MSILLNTINEKTQDQINSLGNISDKARTSGAHLVTVAAVYETTAATWSRFNIDLTTAAGESLQITEFFGNAKDDSQAELDKATKANDRVASMLARFTKATGIKDIKAGTTGSIADTDAKGNATTTFPKYAGKKLTVISYTEIQPSQDETKAYANQEIDTFKFLDKDGNDGMNRNRVEAFEAEAISRIEIQWGKDQVPACVALKAKLAEQALGTAPAPTNPAIPTQPVQTQAAAQVAAQEDDI